MSKSGPVSLPIQCMQRNSCMYEHEDPCVHSHDNIVIWGLPCKQRTVHPHLFKRSRESGGSNKNTLGDYTRYAPPFALLLGIETGSPARQAGILTTILQRHVGVGESILCTTGSDHVLECQKHGSVSSQIHVMQRSSSAYELQYPSVHSD